MSARRTRARGPSQIFKKRWLNVNTFVGSGANAQSQFTMRETGTIYAVRISGSVWHSNTAGGVNRWWASLQHIKGNSATTKLFAASDVNIESTDFLLLGHGIVRADLIDESVVRIEEKYRWRRKVDESETIVLLMENSTTQGTSADTAFSLAIEMWVRVR